MSKSNMNTREKILYKALEMFNERGIEYVGLREIAMVLGIRVSNITYYFPTKDDLVYELSLELGKANTGLLKQRSELSLKDFLEILNQVFLNHVNYRCLLLSVVHLMRQNKHMADSYKKIQAVRKGTLRSNLMVLSDDNYLILEDEDLDMLVSGISLISRFWISEAALSGNKLDFEQEIHYYLRMISKMMLPYATVKGKKEMNAFLDR